MNFRIAINCITNYYIVNNINRKICAITELQLKCVSITDPLRGLWFQYTQFQYTHEPLDNFLAV